MPGHPKQLFVDKEKIHDRLICPFCNRVLKDAIQSTCGHRFCDSCVQEKLQISSEDGSVPRCPACHDDSDEDAIIKEDMVHPDFPARKQVRTLDVKCINDGCRWTSVLNRYISDHQGECEFDLLKCLKSGCGKTLRRSDLAYHLEKDCPMRGIRCRHCGVETVFKNMKKHYHECQKTPVPCKDCGEKIPRELMEAHQDFRTGTCVNRTRSCPFVNLGCTYQVTAGTEALKQHLQNQILHHTELQIAKIEAVLDQGKIWLQSQSVISKLTSDVSDAAGESTEEGACASTKDESSAVSGKLVSQLLPVFQEMFVTRVEQNGDSAKNSVSSVDKEMYDRKIKALEQEVKHSGEDLNKMRTLYAVLDKRNETFQEVVAVLNNQLEAMVEKTNTIQQENRRLREMLEQQERQLNAQDQMLTVKAVTIAEQELRIKSLEKVSYNGILIWKITDFARQRREAISGKTTSFYSQPFYTSYHGYKMRARIYLNGDGVGKGTHLSLFFVVMKGSYDNILRWPFRQKVTFMIVDQSDREHVVDSFRPDPASSSFQQPKNEMNIASGCPMFLSLELLDSNSHQYVKDDCLFVKVVVDISDLERM